MEMDRSNSPKKEINEDPTGFMARYMVRRREELALLREASERTGIRVHVLAKEGEPYPTLPPTTEVHGLEKTPPDFRSVTGQLKDGEIYVMISGTVRLEKGLTNFWAEYDRLKAERNPLN